MTRRKPHIPNRGIDAFTQLLIDKFGDTPEQVMAIMAGDILAHWANERDPLTSLGKTLTYSPQELNRALRKVQRRRLKTLKNTNIRHN